MKWIKVFIYLLLICHSQYLSAQPELSQRRGALLFSKGTILSRTDLMAENKSLLLNAYKEKLDGVFKFQNESDLRVVPYVLGKHKTGLYMIMLSQHHFRQPIVYFLRYEDKIEIINTFSKEEYHEKLIPFLEKYDSDFNCLKKKKLKSFFRDK